MKTTLDERDTSVRPVPPGRRVLAGLADLSPAYFGMVMATGIVSLAAHLLLMPAIAQALFQLNIVVYSALCFLTLLRMACHSRRFFGDMLDHQCGPGFFTTVAGTSILGSQFVVLAADHRAGTALWIVAIMLWIGLTYTIFSGFTIKKHKPTLDKGINGAWLLAVVATQSIAVLSALLAPDISQPYKLEINFLALLMWLWGGMLYIWMMSLIFYRYTFFSLSPGDLSPPYWINMGAMAISTLAGSLLIINAPDAPFLLSMLPFIKGFTIFYWATGTWWIPMLVILFLWRYVYKRFPMKYDPLYWGAVFPLGMYAASTDRMIDAMGFDFIGFLPLVFLYLGFIAWTAVFAGFTFDLLRRVGVSRA
ncbi:MAG: tellurite resistance/C4-dicarboxylate transporter family protein [Methylococcales bacterium]|nr:tellurite resistance/C4-dicarboxylate transporter family protein [Methylococcales bacterium]MDD5630493.1 tellurite resistance/C4-dicarboxylate transporter family protein [Methylococcales bacterium]